MNKTNRSGKSSSFGMILLLLGLFVTGSLVVFVLGDRIKELFKVEGVAVAEEEVLLLSETDQELKETASKLNRLGQESPDNHVNLFQQTSRKFSALRQKMPDVRLIDSLHNLYLARGSNSLSVFEQNGDVNSKRYAVLWYHLAYSLKPSAILEERIERLNVSSKVPAKRQAEPTKTVQKIKPKRKNNALFTKDPELH